MGAEVTVAAASPWLLGEARFALTLARPSWFGRGRRRDRARGAAPDAAAVLLDSRAISTLWAGSWLSCRVHSAGGAGSLLTRRAGLKVCYASGEAYGW